MLYISIPSSQFIELNSHDSFGVSSLQGDNYSVTTSGQSIISFEGQPSSIALKVSEPKNIPFLTFKTNLTQPISINLSSVHNIPNQTIIFAFSISRFSNFNLIEIEQPKDITIALQNFPYDTYIMSGFYISQPTNLLSKINSNIQTLLENEQDTDYYLYVMKPKVKNNKSNNSTGLIVGIVHYCIS